VTILQARELKCNNCDQAKRKCSCNANVILGRLYRDYYMYNTAPSVLLKLMYSQGVPNLLYGITATSLSAGDLKSLRYSVIVWYARFLILTIGMLFLNVSIIVDMKGLVIGLEIGYFTL